MTETTKTVFEKYQVRKSKKQRAYFRDYVVSKAAEYGYGSAVEKGTFGARNIVVGNPESAKVIFTAHYDTCARLPFPNFITPKNFSIYLLYQIVLTFLIIAIPSAAVLGVLAALSVVTGEWELIFGFAPLIVYLALLFAMSMLYAGPANKNTANDNTSGVTALLDIMRDMPDDLKANAAFIFFDLEEMGLLGSSYYASYHRSEVKNTLLINFDCVSDGEHMIFVLKKGARKYEDKIKTAFAGNVNVETEVITKGAFYPSDQANFKCGVGVAALKRSKRFGVLYMDRIHTKKDVIYREENIKFLKNGAIELTKLMSE
ncbi:MAG: M28 family peptidase [Ruminococcaceae bacterium]|nr:M28 family peptidase [Oscillospiraceae bacterium]